MKLLFVSSTTGGGSGRSQRDLARLLRDRGHEVVLLADPKTASRARYLYKRSVNLTTKMRTTWARPLRPPVIWCQRIFGRRLRRDESVSDLTVYLTEIPENGYRTLRRGYRPDVLVASSIDRISWRRLRAAARADGVATVLYLREETAIGHLTITDAEPDLLLANAGSHAAAAELAGFACMVIPSAIDLSSTDVDSTREVALLINPIESHGGDRVWALADANPDIRFVLQESWPLDEFAVAAIEEQIGIRGNVELRRRTDDPSDLYRDARLLLVPHRVDNRPRVVAEAQHNAIPVIASAYAGLVEAVGPGGVTLPTEFDPAAWTEALRRLWDDEVAYDEAVRAAAMHGAREDNDMDLVAQRFEVAMLELIGRRQR